MNVERKYYKNWHLAKSETEVAVTEFEWGLIRLYEAFTRWISATSSLLIDEDVKSSEHMLLHVIRMHNRPKNSITIARMMNRDDLANLQYSLRKLEAVGLISKSKDNIGKSFSYVVTERGKQITDSYAAIRSDILISALQSISDIDERMVEVTKMVSVLTGIYDEMARSSATYNAQY
jgi:predicted MarR family transcription regulator